MDPWPCCYAWAEGRGSGSPAQNGRLRSRSLNGTEDTVEKLTAKDCLDFHRKLFVPNNTTLVVVGDFVTDDRRFRELTGWTPRIGLDDGLARSLKYYRRHLADYI